MNVAVARGSRRRRINFRFIMFQRSWSDPVSFETKGILQWKKVWSEGKNLLGVVVFPFRPHWSAVEGAPITSDADLPGCHGKMQCPSFRSLEMDGILFPDVWIWIFSRNGNAPGRRRQRIRPSWISSEFTDFISCSTGLPGLSQHVTGNFILIEVLAWRWNC